MEKAEFRMILASTENVNQLILNLCLLIKVKFSHSIGFGFRLHFNNTSIYQNLPQHKFYNVYRFDRIGLDYSTVATYNNTLNDAYHR